MTTYQTIMCGIGEVVIGTTVTVIFVFGLAYVMRKAGCFRIR